jgi:magnesium chelatase subunit I
MIIWWIFYLILQLRVEYCRTRRISIRHPAFCTSWIRKPEEGELRPQLLDRFGMHAEIRTVKDPILRVKLWKKERLSTKTRCFGLKIMNLNNKLRDKIVLLKIITKC